MTVKRYDTRIGNSMGLSVPCSEMYENPVGQFVTHSDYQKLVAESEALRQERDDFKKSAEYSAATNKKIVATNTRLSDANIELRSDAAKAEIKAQGVDELANKLDGLPFNCGVNHQYVVSFAANLRAGRKG